MGFLQYWVSMMWFCHHCWHQSALEVFLPCHCVTAATFIPNASSGLCQLCHGFSTGRFLFQSRVFYHFVYYILGVCSGVCFYFQVPCWMQYLPMGAQPLVFAPLQPFGIYLWQAYLQPGDGHWPTPGMHRVAAPSTTLSRGTPFCYSISCSPAIPSIWWSIQLLGLGRESPNPSTFPG